MNTHVFGSNGIGSLGVGQSAVAPTFVALWAWRNLLVARHALSQQQRLDLIDRHVFVRRSMYMAGERRVA
jgi:hypothetical protein